ncbi:MAG: proteasome subunit beta [Candidatus Nanoarchaeia archaeon]|nr:proteasome subunit beta [Candidatus Nanoarchaeia archaeon]
MNDDLKQYIKKGTTTVGIVCKDGIILAADKKATAGFFIADKKVEKVVKLTDNIAVTIAGGVSDLQLLLKLIKAELSLKKIRTGTEPTVKEAANLLATIVYNNIRRFSTIIAITAFIVGGKDNEGFHLFLLMPDGSLSEDDEYVSDGSGSMMAYGVLDSLYLKNMTINEGIKLAKKAINAAIQRDAGSGEGIDVITITKEGVKKVLTEKIDTTLKI